MARPRLWPGKADEIRGGEVIFSAPDYAALPPPVTAQIITRVIFFCWQQQQIV
jgi:hypothetical protein